MESLLQHRAYEGTGSPSFPQAPTQSVPSPPSTANLPRHTTHSRCASLGSGAPLSQSVQPLVEAASVAQLPSARTFDLAPAVPLSHNPPPRLAQSLSGRNATPPPLPADENSNSVDEEENVIPLKSDNCWEHHGPGAWVSICSEPGLRWVCARTGSVDFIQSARGLIRNWTQRLRCKENRSRNIRAREPEEAKAWAYSTGKTCGNDHYRAALTNLGVAFFEACYEAGFGAVHRSTFEDLLKKHFQRGLEAAESEDDPCWYALRNVVYATGCRKILAQDTSISFMHAQAQAWGFFENALSVLRDLVFFPTGLTGVQALALMVSSPSNQFGFFALTETFSRPRTPKGSAVRPSSICSPRTPYGRRRARDSTASHPDRGASPPVKSCIAIGFSGRYTAQTNRWPSGVAGHLPSMMTTLAPRYPISLRLGVLRMSKCSGLLSS